jgi:hypothetical protein
MRDEQIARIAHEAIRMYSEEACIELQAPWWNCSKEQQEATISAVRMFREEPTLNATGTRFMLLGAITRVLMDVKELKNAERQRAVESQEGFVPPLDPAILERLGVDENFDPSAPVYVELDKKMAIDTTAEENQRLLAGGAPDDVSIKSSAGDGAGAHEEKNDGQADAEGKSEGGSAQADSDGRETSGGEVTQKPLSKSKSKKH